MNRSLKIALLGYGSSPHLGRLAQVLANRGHEVSMICRSDDVGPEPVSGIKYYFFSAHDSYIKKIATIRSHLRFLKPDILHSHFLSYGGAIGTLTGFHPHVISLWGCDVINVPHESYLKKVASKATLRGADGWLAVSKHIQEESHMLAGNKANSKVAIWGIDTELFKPQTDANHLKAKWGIQPGTKIIMSPRILQPHYNQHVLLQSFKRLVDEDPNLVLSMSLYNAEPAYEAQLREFVQKNKLEKHVIWQKTLPPNELALLYNAADVVVSIPTTDGTPMTVLEAMSCGALVAASDLPSLRDWMTQDKTGWLVDPQNPDAIYKALKKILSLDPNQKSTLSHAARQVILDRATVDSCASQIEDSYYKAVKKQPGMDYLTTLKNILG